MTDHDPGPEGAAESEEVESDEQRAARHERERIESGERYERERLESSERHDRERKEDQARREHGADEDDEDEG